MEPLKEHQRALFGSFRVSKTIENDRKRGEESRKKLRVLDDRTSQLLAISFNKLPPAERLTQLVAAWLGTGPMVRP